MDEPHWDLFFFAGVICAVASAALVAGVTSWIGWHLAAAASRYIGWL